MDDFLRSIIPNVSAQTADTIAQPTFGPINISSGNTSTGASVLLTSDKTSVTVGEIFTVQVTIKTNDIPINEYRIAIDFDPTLLRVIDEDEATTGTQMQHLDTVFSVDSTQQNNIVTSVGRARLIASLPSTNTQPVNAPVVQIRFQAQATGSARISIVQGTTGTQLVRQAGVGLSFTSNEITIENSVSAGDNGGQAGGDQNGGDTVTGNNGGQVGVDVTTGNGNGGVTTPNTAINPGIVSIFTMLLAIISLFLGLMLKLTSRKSGSDKL